MCFSNISHSFPILTYRHTSAAPLDDSTDEGDGADDDLGIFGADDIQDILKAMEFTIDFVLFGVCVIRTCRNVVLKLSLAAPIRCRSVERNRRFQEGILEVCTIRAKGD